MSEVTATAAVGAVPSDADATVLEPRTRLVITLLLISSFVVILNETIMGVAIPHLMADLGVDANAAQWLTSAFMLTMAVVIPVTGFLLQRWTTRRVFTTAMVLFCCGTSFAAVSPGFESLLLARVVQASGTAIMMPLLFTTVMTLVPERLRGRVMGRISIVISVAPAIGPTISGAILSVLHWRWMFILVLPIALAALCIGIARVPNVTEPRDTRLDVLSVILAALGFGGVVFGLSSFGAEHGGAAGVPSWLALSIGVLTLIAFGLRQLHLQKCDMPLLDLRTFRTKLFSLGISMMSISMIALFGTIILLPIYTQNVLHLTPMTTGLLLLPGGLIMGLLAPTVGNIYDRIGPTPLVICGSILVSCALWTMFLLLGAQSSMWVVLGAHVTMCVGFALLFTPLFTTSLGSLPIQLYSHGSAIVGTIQQLAGAAGIALFVTVMTANLLARQSAGMAELEAMASGIHAALLCGAVISMVTIPLAFFIKKPPSVVGGMAGSH